MGIRVCKRLDGENFRLFVAVMFCILMFLNGFYVFDNRTIRLTSRQAREVMEEYKGAQYEIEKYTTVDYAFFIFFYI